MENLPVQPAVTACIADSVFFGGYSVGLLAVWSRKRRHQAMSDD